MECYIALARSMEDVAPQNRVFGNFTILQEPIPKYD